MGEDNSKNLKKKVLFICLGNICRSPIAEAVFLHLISNADVESNWEVESAALGPWHVGKGPDSRAMSTLKKHKITYCHKARQISKDDFSKFDFIFGMDEDNMEELNELAPKSCNAKLLLLGSFDPQGQRIIRDPYYDSGAEGFEECYQQCVRSCEAFLQTQT